MALVSLQHTVFGAEQTRIVLSNPGTFPLSRDCFIHAAAAADRGEKKIQVPQSLNHLLTWCPGPGSDEEIPPVIVGAARTTPGRLRPNQHSTWRNYFSTCTVMMPWAQTNLTNVNFKREHNVIQQPSPKWRACCLHAKVCALRAGVPSVNGSRAQPGEQIPGP